jgi:hypothetical protein
MAAKKLSGRPCRCQKAAEIISNCRLGTSSYTNVRSTVQHLVKQDKRVNGSRTYANPDKYDNDTNATEERCLS